MPLITVSMYPGRTQQQKDEYAKALRAYQANLVEIKSAQRDEAAAFNDEFEYY